LVLPVLSTLYCELSKTEGLLLLDMWCESQLRALGVPVVALVRDKSKADGVLLDGKLVHGA